MNLYLLTQIEARGYDTWSACVVVAPDAEVARTLYPNGSCRWDGRGWAYPRSYENEPPTYVGGSSPWASTRSWASHPDGVEVRLLGITDPSAGEARVVLASFHPG